MATLPFSGTQLAILLVIVGYLGVPSAIGIAAVLNLPRGHVPYLSQVVSMSIEAAVLVALPLLRERTRELLRVPVKPRHFGEIGAVMALLVLLQFAHFGWNALETWTNGGDAALAGLTLSPERRLEAALGVTTLASILITCIAAPVIEELLYRGFLFDAWTRTRPMWAAMLLSSFVFALIHPTFRLPFAAGLLFCALYVRTGSIRAVISAHFVTNAANWFLLPRILIPDARAGIDGWWFHLLCLALLPVVIAVYVMVAAKPRDNVAPTAHEAST